VQNDERKHTRESEERLFVFQQGPEHSNTQEYKLFLPSSSSSRKRAAPLAKCPVKSREEKARTFLSPTHNLLVKYQLRYYRAQGLFHSKTTHTHTHTQTRYNSLCRQFRRKWVRAPFLNSKVFKQLCFNNDDDDDDRIANQPSMCVINIWLTSSTSTYCTYFSSFGFAIVSPHRTVWVLQSFRTLTMTTFPFDD